MLFDQVDLGPVVAMASSEIPYVRIDARGMLAPRELAALLADRRLLQFVAKSGRSAVLLNTAAMDRFGTEDSEWLATSWAPMLAAVGVRRISVVLSDSFHSLMGSVITTHAARAVPAGVEVRGFPLAQFTRSFESVSWFDPLPTPAASPPVGPFAPAAGTLAPAVVPGAFDLAMVDGAWHAAGVRAAFTGLLIGPAVVSWISFAQSQSSGIAPRLGNAPLGTGALLGIVLTPACVWLVSRLRGLPVPRIQWDAQGLVEMDGDRPRTTIAWRDARYALQDTPLRTRPGSPVQYLGRTLQVRADGGRSITVCQGRRPPVWLRDRPCHVPDIAPILANVREPAIPPLVRPDARARGRFARVAFGLVALIAYALLLQGTLMVHQSTYYPDSDHGATLVLGACALSLVRASWPLAMWRRARGTRTGRYAAPVELAMRVAVTLIVLAAAVTFMAHIDRQRHDVSTGTRPRMAEPCRAARAIVGGTAPAI